MTDHGNPEACAERDPVEHARILRIAVREKIDGGEYSMKDVSLRSDIGHSTLSAYLNDNYSGNIGNINDKLQRWLDALMEQARQRKRRAEPAFLDLPSSRVFMDVFAFAQGGPEMGMITGGAGVGKTKAALEYQNRGSNVWVMTADASMRSPTSILRELAAIVGAPDQRGTRMLASILKTVSGTGGLLIVDEAQNLSTESIDLLRTLYDRGAVGVVFIGNEPLRLRIEGMGREASHAMIYSRIGMRRKRTQPQLKDVHMMLDAWDVTDAPLRKACRFIAMQPGGIRSMNKTLGYAHMLASGTDRSTINYADLQSAWSQLTNGALPSMGDE